MNVGDIIDGKYELIRELGRGGMGSVYEGRHVEIGRRVALKLLNAESTGNSEVAARFLREAQAAAQVGSDHIVEVYDVGRLPNGSPYLVMELLQGQTLTAVIKRCGQLEPAVAVGIALQICEALAPAHAAGIVHRDLKPDNLFLTTLAGREGWLKVLDFGIAKVRKAAGDGSTINLTRTGMTMGTPYYMAPEQFMGAKDVDWRADVYAVGVILFEMLSGRPPFVGSTYEEVIIKAAAGNPPSPSELRPELDPGLATVVLRAMASDVAARLPSMEALAEELRPFANPTVGASIPVTLAAAPVEPDSVPSWGSDSATGAEAPGATPSSPSQPAMATPQPSQTGPASTPSAWESTPPAAPTSKKWLIPALIGGVLLMLVAAGGGAAVILAGDDESAAPAPRPPAQHQPNPAAAVPPSEPEQPEPLNRWVRVEPAPPGTTLGLPASAVAEGVRGFRPERGVTAPTYAFELQQHEVTWQELRPWLEQHPDHEVPRPGWLPEENDERFPATAVPWDVALAYCRSLGGSLPTEEQWELAARGRELRPHPWGNSPVDLARTQAFRPGQPLKRVMTSDQDVTPGDPSRAIHDLAGNAREWTADLFRLDVPATAQQEAWTQAGGRTFRAVRGLPPMDEPPVPLPSHSAAYRRPLCATGPCTANEEQTRRYRELMQYIGFRCARRTTSQ